MKLQRQLLALTLFGGLALAAAQPAAAQTDMAPPDSSSPSLAIPESAPPALPESNIVLAASTVTPAYPDNPRPAVRRNPFAWLWHQPLIAEGPRETFANTTPGYMGEQNARQ